MVFCAVAGAWLVRAAGLPEARWGRLTYNWPVPWPRLRPATQRLIRAGCGLAGGALIVAAALLAARR